MKGDSTTENEVESGENETVGERRPSLVTLQNTLKKVSQSPFHKHHKSQVDGDPVKSTTFYEHFLESSRKYNVEEAIRGPSEGGRHDAVALNPPVYQRSSADLTPKIEAKEHGTMFSDSLKDSSHSHVQNPFSTSLPQNTPARGGHFSNMTMNSPGDVGTSSLQSWDISTNLPPNNSDLFQVNKARDLLRAAPAKEINLLSQSPSISMNPFRSSPTQEVHQPTQPEAVNPFHTSTTDGLFKPRPSPRRLHMQLPSKENLDVSSEQNLDIFSPSSANAVDPFPTPVSKTLFLDSPNPFDTHSYKQFDPFKDLSHGTADIFQLLPSRTVNTTAPAPTSSLISPSDDKVATLLSSSVDLTPGLLKATPSGSDLAAEATLPNRSNEMIPSSPEGANVFQPSPFSQEQTLSSSPRQSPELTRVGVFKRPPKPLPRTAGRRREKPPKPANPIDPKPAAPRTPPKPVFKPLPKPVFPKKPNIPVKTVDPENYVAFEDILLLGQECCVEDWPEDSPEVNPDYRPSGKLKLRRESQADSNGGRGTSPDRSASPASLLKKKIRMSLSSRREQKEKYTGDIEGRSMTLPHRRKLSKDDFDDASDVEVNGIDHKGKPGKTKFNHLFRRASTNVTPEAKHMNGYVPQESRDDDFEKKSGKKVSSVRRWSEGSMLEEYSPEEDDGADELQEGAAVNESKKKKNKVKSKSSHRGHADSSEKNDDRVKGAHGQTLPKDSKDKFADWYRDGSGARKKSKGTMLDEYSPEEDDGADELQDGATVHGPKKNKVKKFLSHRGHAHASEKSDNKVKGVHGQALPKGSKDKFPDWYGDGSGARKKSKDVFLDDDCCQSLPASAGFTGDEAAFGMEECKLDVFVEGDAVTSRKVTASFAEMHDPEKDEVEVHKLKKPLKLKGLKKLRAKHNKSNNLDSEGPPGATSSDYFLSEAAQAEWRAAQKDELSAAGVEDDEEEGDTDSLMEWWNTVEQWDEVPSDEEDAVLKEDESKSFTILADKVHRGLRVFNKVFTENAEFLWGSIVTLHTIADDISNFHHKAKIAGITGGTTTAVGGVTAIAGLALAPFTFGASLVITAVGVGVATAGGIASASAAISDNVNNMHDRKKVETVLLDYESQLLDLGKILHFVNHGLYKLRGHPFLRSGTQHYSEDWEVRKAVQMISLVDAPVMRATEISDTALASVQGLFKGMDNYFVKETRELKKGCKKEIVCEIKEVAGVLNNGIVELNCIREQLQDATGTL
ncbi:uncharacterized protein LOC117505129 isoform X3 [Thalassophryne amazonica]|uniref:uncharacterized protein LOC117505129 isoform X3 n=1 Tax=Thalassophryne amazonica TaxID=390379 RepID=UPI001472431E|nr:uncharacterized protein LOC117505129 isoform X3 [Thalassophryne amazonica]